MCHSQSRTTGSTVVELTAKMIHDVGPDETPALQRAVRWLGIYLPESVVSRCYDSMYHFEEGVLWQITVPHLVTVAAVDVGQVTAT